MAKAAFGMSPVEEFLHLLSCYSRVQGPIALLHLCFQMFGDNSNSHSYMQAHMMLIICYITSLSLALNNKKMMLNHS